MCSNCGDKKYITTFGHGDNYARAILCPKCSSECQICDGSGYVVKKDSKGLSITYRCRCSELIERLDKYNNARLPAKLFDADFDNFDTSSNKESWEQVLQVAEKFVANVGGRIGKVNFHSEGNKMPDKGFLFFGRPGTGKTRLLSVILKHLTLNYSVDCRFIEFSELIRDIKRSYDNDESEAELMDPLLKTDILGVDELGKGRKSDWWLGILDNIISQRYNMGKTTIFTTNYFPDKYKNNIHYIDSGEESNLLERLNSRIYSRLHEMCEFVDMNFEDYRQREYETYSVKPNINIENN